MPYNTYFFYESRIEAHFYFSFTLFSSILVPDDAMYKNPEQVVLIFPSRYLPRFLAGPQSLADDLDVYSSFSCVSSSSSSFNSASAPYSLYDKFYDVCYLPLDRGEHLLLKLKPIINTIAVLIRHAVRLEVYPVLINIL